MGDEQRKLKVGDTCIYHDEKGRALNALVTCVHGDDWGNYIPCINLVFVSLNEKETDEHGRQTKHSSSVTHKSNAGAHGYYWRFADEEPIPYKEPAQT